VTVRVLPFHPLSAEAVRALTTEAAALLGFLEPDADTAVVRIDDPVGS